MTEQLDPVLNEKLALAAEFPPTDAAQWRQLVDAALKGADFNKRLVSRTYDGLDVQPLYARATGAAAIAGRPAAPWQVVQRVDHPDPKAANAQALNDLENGATALSLVFAGSTGAYGYGLDGKRETIAKALDGIYLDAGVAIELDTSPHHKDAGQNLAAVLKERGVAPADTQIRFGYDPLGAMARRGAARLPWPELAKAFAGIVGELSVQGFKGPIAVADGRAMHAASGTEAQEIAFVVGNAVEYLRVLTAAGMPLEQARDLVCFRCATGADQFVTLAKFRALRKVWARVEEASGLAPKPAFVTAETAWRMMTTRDAYVNMLRATMAVTAAGLGGADAICALPFTIARGLPDKFARRVARNLQLVLLEESNLYRVADPAAGSGGIEALTTGIAETAWKHFQEIEAAGGAAEAILRGVMQKKVAATRAAREANIARRKDALTGTSDYPNLAEAPLRVLDVPRVTVPATPAAISFDALPAARLAEPFEALRDRSDAILARAGSRPKVFLANLGRLADFTARATFAKNFYEAGGIETPGNDGFKDQAEMVAAFKVSGARLACICGSDKLYDVEAAQAAAALTQAGAIVHLAGRPGDNEEKWRQAGVREFLFMGCDVVSTLRAAHDSLSQDDGEDAA